MKELSALSQFPESMRPCKSNILNWQGTGGGGKEESGAKTASLRKTKKKNHNASSAHSKTHPRNLQRVKKSTANCKRKSFPLTLRTVFSCQITTQKIILLARIKRETKSSHHRDQQSVASTRFQRKNRAKGTQSTSSPPPPSLKFIPSPDRQTSTAGAQFNINNNNFGASSLPPPHP